VLHFLLDNWYLVLIAAVSGGLLVWPALTRAQGGGGVTPAQAVQLINREKAVVVDVSEPGEFAAAHLIGARNVPLGQLDASRELPSNKQLPVIVVCASGNRAARAAKALQAKGHAKAVALAGGLAAWRAADLPVEKARAAA
jgi:rhodanese-related sulfurtransferase